MAKHNETGIKGEKIAEIFLANKGYLTLYRNWCYGKKEVDLIMLKNDTIVFAEVKTRTGVAFGFPEDAVDYRKQGFLKAAAEAFLEEHLQYRKIQFDIVSIQMKAGGQHEIHHFEDTFY